MALMTSRRILRTVATPSQNITLRIDQAVTTHISAGLWTA